MTSAKYSNADNTLVEISHGGRTMTVPADANNALFRKISDEGTPIDAFVETAPAESSDPADWPLSRFQFEGMLLAMGVTFNAVETAITDLDMTATEKAFAISRLRNAVTYNRTHPLIALLAPVFSLTDAQIDAAWMEAKDIR